mmetsp:Transcript_16912/g.25439  ORF Transcript_16912/g.25439 Transcript_16912/m.25439 type:complete len:208 (+) Transcript_16912:821-1444(+)
MITVSLHPLIDSHPLVLIMSVVLLHIPATPTTIQQCRNHLIQVNGLEIDLQIPSAVLLDGRLQVLLHLYPRLHPIHLLHHHLEDMELDLKETQVLPLTLEQGELVVIMENDLVVDTVMIMQVSTVEELHPIMVVLANYLVIIPVVKGGTKMVMHPLDPHHRKGTMAVNQDVDIHPQDFTVVERESTTIVQVHQACPFLVHRKTFIHF